MLGAFSMRVRRHAKMGPATYAAFLEGAEFKRRFDGLEPRSWRKAMQIVQEAEKLTRIRDPLPPPVQPKPLGSTARPPRWVDPTAQAQLRAAYAKMGTIEGTARLLRVTPGAARRALERYVLHATTSSLQLAA